MSIFSSQSVNVRKSDMAVVKTKNVINSEKVVDVNNKRMRVRVSPMGSSSSKISFGGNHAQLLIQNHANFKRSGEPGRVMYYNDDGSWVDYPKEVAELVKSCFAEGRAVAEVNIHGSTCLIDFYRMLEIDFGTGLEKSIAWIDVNGKCFFPQVFINSGGNVVKRDAPNENGASLGQCPKIEIEVRICDNSKASGNLDLVDANLSKRKRENEELEVEQVVREKSEGSSSNAQAKRRRIAVNEMGMPRWPKTRLMRAEERGFTIVKNLFLSGLGTMEPCAVITRIHQCIRTGPMLKASCDVFLKEAEIVKKARGESNMVFAWHGTSAKGVESILTRGFGLSNLMQGSQAYGDGVHLSSLKFPYNSALISEVDNNGEKHVILCRALLGKCEKVEAGSQQMYPSHVDFDTGVDDLENPRWYVVWRRNMNTHILPEVVVSYKPGNNDRVQLTDTSYVKLVPTSVSPLVANLISRLRSSLPPPKVEELQKLYSLFKAGRMEKEIFLKQLRSVVGDGLLRSLINAIRG